MFLPSQENVRSSTRKELAELLSRGTDQWTEKEVDFIFENRTVRFHDAKNNLFYYALPIAKAAYQYPNLFRQLVQRSLVHGRPIDFYTYACSVALSYALKKDRLDKEKLLKLWEQLKTEFDGVESVKPRIRGFLFNELVVLRPSEVSVQNLEFFKKPTAAELEKIFFIDHKNTLDPLELVYFTAGDSRFEDFKHFLREAPKESISLTKTSELLGHLAMNCQDDKLFQEKTRYLIESQALDFKQLFIREVLKHSPTALSTINITFSRAFLHKLEILQFFFEQLETDQSKYDFLNYLISVSFEYSRNPNARAFLGIDADSIGVRLAESALGSLEVFNSKQQYRQRLRLDSAASLSSEALADFLYAAKLDSSLGEFPIHLRAQILSSRIDEIYHRGQLSSLNLQKLLTISKDLSIINQILSGFPEEFQREVSMKIKRMLASRKNRRLS